MKYYYDNIAITSIEWDCTKTEYEDHELPNEVKIVDIPEEIIRECIEDKSYDPIIDYLSDKYEFGIISCECADDLIAIVENGCNLYEVNCQITGHIYVDYDDELSEEEIDEAFDQAFDEMEIGVLHDVDSGERNDNTMQITGYYSFGIAAKTENEAEKLAESVFEEHWNNGDVDCGDIENTEADNDFTISDVIEFNNSNKNLSKEEDREDR